MSPKRNVAIFDIDGTVLRTSIFTELVEELIKKEVFPEEARGDFYKEKKAWIERTGPYQDYIDAVVDSFMRNIQGVPYATFMDISRSIVERNRWHTYIYTRSLIYRLQEEGYYLLAISQSPKGVLDELCSSFGFDKVYGRIYELGPEDRFTGNISDLHLIANKANIVRRVMEKENIDLKGSIGVGDTDGDISFLEMVDHPVCFNPNYDLYRKALLNSWRIVVERKDVIYHISAPDTDPDILTFS